MQRWQNGSCLIYFSCQSFFPCRLFPSKVPRTPSKVVTDLERLAIYQQSSSTVKRNSWNPIFLSQWFTYQIFSKMSFLATCPAEVWSSILNKKEPLPSKSGLWLYIHTIRVFMLYSKGYIYKTHCFLWGFRRSSLELSKELYRWYTSYWVKAAFLLSKTFDWGLAYLQKHGCLEFAEGCSEQHSPIYSTSHKIGDVLKSGCH